VLGTVRANALIGPEDRVAVALSGGPDSVALVWLLRELTSAGELKAGLTGLIHVNHGLRGEEAERDEAFCRELAGRLSLPIEVARLDVAEAARAERRSIEAVARDLRYRFFAEAADRLGATVVATGHTLDDQAETVLMRLLRGAGSRGLTGIRVRRGRFIRPLLECRRADLRGYLAARDEPFCEDSSNASFAIARNRIRHQLIPVIRDIAPGGIAALARLASLAAADEAYLEAHVSEVAPSVVLTTEGGVQLDTGRLAAQPAAIGRRLVRQALERVAPARGVSASHLDAVLELARASQPSGFLDLSGVTAERRGAVILLEPAKPSGRAEQAAGFELPLPVPGCIDVPAAGLSVSAWMREDGGSLLSLDADAVAVQAGALALPLVVRSRRPGDRLQPLGAPGRRKLQDLLVDRKVPRADRDRVPLVVDAAGRIVWVAGVTIAEECRVTAPSAGVVVLKVQKRILS
jgi:tRNA(Ile)-lysidine synthase